MEGTCNKCAWDLDQDEGVIYKVEATCGLLVFKLTSGTVS